MRFAASSSGRDAPERAVGRRVETWLALSLFVTVNLLSQLFQHPITFNQGQGWDGSFYFSVAQQLAQHSYPTTESPFVYRIGTPLLATLFFKNDLLRGFKIVNIAANTITAVLFLYWLRLYLDSWKTRIFLFALFQVLWLAPTRFVYFYPALTDPWAMAVLLAGLIGIHKVKTQPTTTRIAMLGIVVMIGVIFREVALGLAAAFLFCRNPIPVSDGENRNPFEEWRLTERIPIAFFIPLALGALAYLCVWTMVVPAGGYSFAKAAGRWAYEKPLLSYLHAWFIVFGPMLAIAIYFWRDGMRFLLENQFMLMYMLGIAALAWIGGSDTERFLIWIMPVIYVLIGRAIERNRNVIRRRPIGTAVLLVSQLISERVFWVIPDYPSNYPTPIPMLTIMSNKFQYLDLFSFHGRRTIEAASQLEYFALAILTMAWLAFAHSKSRGGTTSETPD